MKADLDKASNGSESLYIPIKQGLENTLSLGIAKIGNYSTLLRSTKIDFFSLKSYDSLIMAMTHWVFKFPIILLNANLFLKILPSQKNEIPPYDQAFGFTLKYMRNFLIQNLYDDKPSFGLGLGGFLSGMHILTN